MIAAYWLAVREIALKDQIDGDDKARLSKILLEYSAAPGASEDVKVKMVQEFNRIHGLQSRQSKI
jgi:hypothetical protein